MSKEELKPAVAAAPVTTSIKLSELTVEQLVQLSQGLGHQIERLREQRQYLKVKIAERLAAGETESANALKAAGGAAAAGPAVDGQAQGAVIAASAKAP